MSNSATDIPEMDHVRARNAACFVWFLLQIDSGKFIRENFPHGFAPHPTPKDFEEEDLHTYDQTWEIVDSLKRTLHEVNDGTPEFNEYERLLYWCEKILDNEVLFPLQEAAQLDEDRWPRWARVRRLKRGIYRGGRK